jgi:hypothetical protein
MEKRIFEKMIEGHQIVFLAFADSRLRASLERIRGEAEAMGCFDAIYCWNQHDLDREWLARHASFIRRNNRGFGYWIWKAQCVKQVLEAVPDGCLVLYANAGCCLNREGLPRLSEYCRMVAEHPSHRLVFQLTELPEEDWTKEYTLQRLGFTSPLQRLSGQILAGIFLVQKTPRNLEFIAAYSQRTQEYDLINDETIIPNSPVFRDHRHDQSVWSILNKLDSPLLLPDETYFEGAWDQHKHFPVHARRLRA